jgi:hypothetical protein
MVGRLSRDDERHARSKNRSAQGSKDGGGIERQTQYAAGRPGGKNGSIKRQTQYCAVGPGEVLSATGDSRGLLERKPRGLESVKHQDEGGVACSEVRKSCSEDGDRGAATQPASENVIESCPECLHRCYSRHPLDLLKHCPALVEIRIHNGLVRRMHCSF